MAEHDLFTHLRPNFLQRVRIGRSAYRCNSYGLSVRPSVTFRCFVQKNEDTIVRFSASK